MVSRRGFVLGSISLRYVGAQNRMDAAKSFVDQTHALADTQGKVFATQDMLGVTMTVLLRANDVAEAFVQYQAGESQVRASLQSTLNELMMAPDLIKGQKEQLQVRYSKLKTIIRNRYEASWLPTNLDKAETSLAAAFETAATRLSQLATTGRAQDLNGEPQSFFGPPQNVSAQKPECKFMSLSPNVSTGGQNRGYNPGDQGSFFFSCPGPDGQNDWIQAANFFGYSANLAFTVTATVPNPYSFAIGCGLAILSLVTGAVGIWTAGSAIEEETKLATEADIYKFLHSAVPEDIVKAYQGYASKYVVLLREAASDVNVFLGPPSPALSGLSAKHEAERLPQLALGDRLAQFEQVKCRMNRRGRNPPLITTMSSCPALAGVPDDPASDEQFHQQFQSDVTVDKLWGFVRWKVIEMLKTKQNILGQSQERLVWLQIDQSIERQFLRLMSSLSIVDDISQCFDGDPTDTLKSDLKSQQQYLDLRSSFTELVTTAIQAVFGEISKAEYHRKLTEFQAELNQFAQTEGARSSKTDGLLKALALLKGRTV